jgi:hypothetical protein
MVQQGRQAIQYGELVRRAAVIAVFRRTDLHQEVERTAAREDREGTELAAFLIREQFVAPGDRVTESPLVRRPALLLGGDNEYVVKELLGRSAGEYQRLVDEGILH